MKLAIFNIFLGIALIVAAVVYALTGLPTTFHPSDGVILQVMYSPDISGRFMFFYTTFLLLGLGVLVTGIAQLVKARSKKAA